LLVHPKNPRVRRIWIAVEIALLVLAAGWLGWRALSGPALTVRLVDVSGFNEDLKNWMRFSAVVEMTNDSGRTIGINRVDVEPDLDGFNEAYGQAVPYLSPPLLVEDGSTTRHTAVVTLLNSTQLQWGTYGLVFRVRVETEDGDTILEEFPAEFVHTPEPAERALRR
jgi:hypothetical protein